LNNIVKNTTIYTIGKVLPQAANFILLPVYTNYLTPRDYGIVNSLQVFSSILLILFTLALDRAIYRLFFDYKTETEQKECLGTITVAIFIVASVSVLFTFISNNYVVLMYKSINFYPYYALIILSTYFSVFSIVPLVYYQITEKASKFVILSVIQFIITTLCILWYLVVKQLGAEGMLEGMLIANIAMIPIFLVITYKHITIKIKTEILKDSLKYSLPIIPGLIGVWVVNLIDRVFIERYFNLQDVGIYSLGYKIAGLVLIISSALGTAYNPIFFKLANSADQDIAKRELYKYNKIFILLILLICFGISFFSKEIIYFLVNKKYFEAYKIIPLISFSYIFSQIASIFSLMFYQNKKTSQLMLINLIGAGLNISLNFFLIPNYGLYGAAYSTILSFIFIFIMLLINAKKYYYIPIDWKQFFSILILFITLYTVFAIVSIPPIFSLLSKIGVIIFIGHLIYFKYRMQIKSVVMRNN